MKSEGKKMKRLLLLLLALAFFGVALLAHALSLLVRRAAVLQRDSDLTI